MSGDADLAEDLCQDVFVRALKGLSTYERRDRDRAWLLRIARNLLLDHWKKLSRRPSTTELRHQDAEARMQDPLAIRRLQQALAGLAEPEREAFLLREIGGLSYLKLASMTDSTEAAVRSRIYRARRALRQMLQEVTP